MIIKSVFNVFHKDGYAALVSEREIEGETIFILSIQNELFQNLKELKLTKRNGEWVKHKVNISDPLFSFWGSLIDQHFEKNNSEK